MPRKPINDKPMTNAERARRYRDRRRGGPARDPLKTSTAIGRRCGISRSTIYRVRLIDRWAPELLSLVPREMKIAHALDVAIRRRDMAIMKAVSEGDS